MVWNLLAISLFLFKLYGNIYFFELDSNFANYSRCLTCNWIYKLFKGTKSLENNPEIILGFCRLCHYSDCHFRNRRRNV